MIRGTLPIKYDSLASDTDGSRFGADDQFQRDDPSANAVLEYALGVVGCTHGESLFVSPRTCRTSKTDLADAQSSS
jgi:hypothetical protein